MRSSVWRHASRTPTVFGIPATAFIPLLSFCFYISWATLYFSIASIAFFTVLQRGFGFTVPMLIGRLRHKLRGKHVYARPWWWRKRYQQL